MIQFHDWIKTSHCEFSLEIVLSFVISLHSIISFGPVFVLFVGSANPVVCKRTWPRPWHVFEKKIPKNSTKNNSDVDINSIYRTIDNLTSIFLSWYFITIDNYTLISSAFLFILKKKDQIDMIYIYFCWLFCNLLAAYYNYLIRKTWNSWNCKQLFLNLVNFVDKKTEITKSIIGLSIFWWPIILQLKKLLRNSLLTQVILRWWLWIWAWNTNNFHALEKKLMKFPNEFKFNWNFNKF